MPSHSIYMSMQFSKMHGLGNDFVVVDGTEVAVILNDKQVRQLCDRHVGIGCDQLLIVESCPNANAFIRIFNADGSIAEQCGNGLRCVARWLAQQGMTGSKAVRLATTAGTYEAKLMGGDQVRINMGVPAFEPAEIPFEANARAESYALKINDLSFEIGAVSMGNPHAIFHVENIKKTAVGEIGPQVEKHSRFPERANVAFMQKISAVEVRLRVWERGAGETQACGSSACAAVAWGHLRGQLDENVRVRLPGGCLEINWQGEGAPVYLTGPATFVYRGEIET